MSAARQKQMSERMRDISMMMDGMSGMMGKGDDGRRAGEKMTKIRKQMDAMQKDAAPGIPAQKVIRHSHPKGGK